MFFDEAIFVYEKYTTHIAHICFNCMLEIFVNISFQTVGHEAYKKGSSTIDKVVETFGEDVLTEDGEINRKALGPKVFADKVQLLLNLINMLILKSSKY